MVRACSTAMISLLKWIIPDRVISALLNQSSLNHPSGVQAKSASDADGPLVDQSPWMRPEVDMKAKKKTLLHRPCNSGAPLCERWPPRSWAGSATHGFLFWLLSVICLPPKSWMTAPSVTRLRWTLSTLLFHFFFRLPASRGRSRHSMMRPALLLMPNKAARLEKTWS